MKGSSGANKINNLVKKKHQNIKKVEISLNVPSEEEQD